jgi:anti-anti-sigma regulatory factor
MKSSRDRKSAATRRTKPTAKSGRAVRKAAAPRASRRKTSAPAPGTTPIAQPDVEAALIEAVEVAPSQPAVAQPAAVPSAPAVPTAAPAAPQRAGLKLESSFTLRDATDMLFQLLAVDFGDSEVLIDGGGVERIDTAGLQMLIAFARTHAARGKTLQWTAVSPELLRSSLLLGVAEPLHLTAHLNEGASGGH